MLYTKVALFAFPSLLLAQDINLSSIEQIASSAIAEATSQLTNLNGLVASATSQYGTAIPTDVAAVISSVNGLVSSAAGNGGASSAASGASGMTTAAASATATASSPSASSGSATGSATGATKSGAAGKLGGVDNQFVLGWSAFGAAAGAVGVVAGLA